MKLLSKRNGSTCNNIIFSSNIPIDSLSYRLLIGGAMAYTFLKAKGFTVGRSLVETHQLQTALEIKQRCVSSGVQLLLPTDHQGVDSYEPVNGSEIVAKTIPMNPRMRGTRVWWGSNRWLTFQMR